VARIPARSIEQWRAPELCWVNAQVNTMRDVLEDISEERKKDSNDEDACEGECDLPWVP